MLLCSVVMALGTSVGGEKIIKSVGMDMVKLEKYQGFAADLAGAFLPSAFQRIWYSGIHHTYEDKFYYGCGRGETSFGNQLFSCQGYDAHMDLYFPGMRADQFCNGQAFYVHLLNYGGLNNVKETGYVLF